MSGGVSLLTDAYRNAVQKRTQLDPADWCRENVSLSARPTPARIVPSLRPGGPNR